MIFIWAILILLVIAYLVSPKPAGPVSYLNTDTPGKTCTPTHWKGTPVDRKGRFVNAEHPFYQDLLKILIWLPGHLINLTRCRKMRLPVQYHQAANLPSENDTIIWLGHASFFIRINNMNILIDPHFYNTVIYKRHTGNPIIPENFTNISYILLSHDHADHCDKKSLRLLIRNNPDAVILCGLKMDVLVQSFVKQKVHVHTTSWYGKFPADDSLSIHFVPSRHYSKRLFDKFNSRLWGGFVIRYRTPDGNSKTIYYAGDSGYGSHFKEIKELYHPAIAILPIGSYMPRWFMKPNHMSPGEAVCALNDCGAGRMIPMHFGTFNLSNENMQLPKKKLLGLIPENKLIDLQVGEIFRMSRT